MASCTASTTVDPAAGLLTGVPRSTQLNDLTLEQWTEFCQWSLDYNGGPTRSCAIGGPSTVDVEACTDEYELYNADSPGYLGAAIQCRTDRQVACDTTGIISLAPSCVAAASIPPL